MRSNSCLNASFRIFFSKDLLAANTLFITEYLIVDRYAPSVHWRQVFHCLLTPISIEKPNSFFWKVLFVISGHFPDFWPRHGWVFSLRLFVYFWLCWVFLAPWAFLRPYAGFLLWRRLSCGALALRHGLRSCGAQASVARGVDAARTRDRTCVLWLAGGFLPTVPPTKSVDGTKIFF